MPSDIAREIVDKIFGDSKQDAVDSVNDALATNTMNLIQARKLDFAKSMGFDLDQKDQEDTDEVVDSLPDGNDEPKEVEVGDEVETPTAETEETPDTEEETTDETDQ